MSLRHILRLPALGSNTIIKSAIGASLLAQWLRIRLPIQGTRV